ncbi:efflux transporter outer membrane subunit [Desulfonatronovibrio hydrogenovorans]|nr:efflux transporter outer membrane subunit [Desulfonatronovibrio hydrogenovorans]
MNNSAGWKGHFCPGLLFLVVLFLGGCAMGSDHKLRKPDLPGTWPETEALTRDGQDYLLEWWTRFEDPMLNQLVAKAVQDNPDIRVQAARVWEARARLGFARAEQLPTVGVQAEAVRQRQPEAVTGIPGGSRGNLFSLAGLLEFELDIWGRLAMEREAAQAVLLESQYTQEAVRQGVISDVVVTYFNLVAAREELEITRQTLELRKQTYELERIRFEAGQVDELVLGQAESALEKVRALVPDLKRQVRILEGALGVLTGLSPLELFDDDRVRYGLARSVFNPGAVPLVLPSELLNRRSDIRSAEARARATGTAIGIARAERLPRLNLSGLLGTLAPETRDLFTSSARNWSMGAQAAGPLLDFGRTRAGVEAAQAQYVQAEIQYEAVVSTAFNEVRDALAIYQSAQNREEAVLRLVGSVERTRNLAKVRYQEGMISFLEFLEAEQDLFAARQDLNNAVRDRLVAVATLSKALGGGWDPDSIERYEVSSAVKD